MKASWLAIPSLCGLCLLSACGGSGGTSLTGATHFAVTTPAAANAGTAFNNLTVTALDASNHTFTTYSGTVRFTSTDGSAALPVPSVLTNGVGIFTATFNSSGMQTITATDTVNQTITGMSNETQVCCAAPAGTFTPTGSMQFAREGHTATLLQDGTVLIAGGEGPGANPFGPLATAEIYNPTTGMFTPTAGSMETARVGHTATLLTNGNVLVTGGNDAARALATAEIFDPATGMFTPTAGNMENNRVGHTATLLNDGSGRVLVAGGGTVPGVVFGPLPIGDVGTFSAELFDPKSGQFTPVGNDMSARRVYHTATLLSNGDVLLAGGTSPPLSVLGQQPILVGDLFSPASAMFTATSSGGTTAVHPAATTLQDGNVLITGGEVGSSACGVNGGNFWSSLRNALFFINSDTSFVGANEMSASRTSHTATLLPGGEVLIAGGAMGQGNCVLHRDEFAPLASAELFNSANGTFTPTGSMEGTRAGHTATLLSNGKVLLVGGTGGGDNAALATAELFQ